MSESESDASHLDHARLASHWELNNVTHCPEIEIHGSPTRVLGRCVVKAGKDNDLYLFEQVAPKNRKRKVEIAALLASLSENGLRRVDPYLPTSDGQWHACVDGDFWQLRRYTPGVELPRPSYIYDRWRGRVAADALLSLRRALGRVQPETSEPVFSVWAFAHEFIERLRPHRPEFVAEIEDILTFVKERYVPYEADLTTGYCHGDFHPMNVVWGEDDILRLIDWEFCGPKPELYDVALMAGCFAMENPEGLTGGAFKEFVGTLRRQHFGTEHSWSLFL
ncbi:MAG: aminoglycoside phosphotransferase family protein, partial [Lentisphaerae bacterium]|nr:aminoglycoside phosphotransferase family protein [Lentisphaerota bacterium]